jgi:hypothetical protein
VCGVRVYVSVFVSVSVSVSVHLQACNRLRTVA